MKLRSTALAGCALLALMGTANAQDADSKMVSAVFDTPRYEWKQTLAANQALLTEDFFAKVDQRIHWSVSHDEDLDAINFALVGDLGSQVARRDAHYRLALAQEFYGTKDYDSALMALDVIGPDNATDAELDQALDLQARVNEARKTSK